MSSGDAATSSLSSTRRPLTRKERRQLAESLTPIGELLAIRRGYLFEDRAAPRENCTCRYQAGRSPLSYDDGNGLWITSGETPFDQDFFRCVCPQE